MCPVCIANLTLIAAGASSTGGLAAFGIKKLFWKSEQKHQTNGIGEARRKMGKNGTEREAIESSLLKFTTTESEK